MKTNIGIADKERKAIAAVLEGVLADEMVLLVKTKSFHWNVVGPHFTELHELFDAQYAEIASYVDETAERIRALGYFASGTMAGYIKMSRLKEQSETAIKAANMIGELLEDHETIIRQLRKDIVTTDEKYGDAGTADFLTELIKVHEKTAWMLRSHIA